MKGGLDDTGCDELVKIGRDFMLADGMCLVKPLDPIDVHQLSEGQDLEVKKAAGKGGRGKLPQSFFETYAAMANTTGGVILLGIEEKPGGCFRARGIEDVDGVLTELWNGVNDPHRVSVNLLDDASTRATTYFLPGEGTLRREGTLFDMVDDHAAAAQPSSARLGTNSVHSDGSSEHLGESSVQTGPSSVQFGFDGDPILATLAEPVRRKKRAPRRLVEEVIVELCAERFLTIQQIASLLARSPETVRVHYVNPMVRSGRLKPRYPDQMNHPNQAYRTAGTD